MNFKSFNYVLFALLLSSLLFSSNANSIEKIIDQQGILYLSDKVVVGTYPGSKPLRTGDFDSQGFTTGYQSLDRLCRENGIVKIEKYYKARLRPGNIKDVVDRMYILTTDGNRDPWTAADAISVDNNLRYAEVY
ncbi:MAG: hypothetical protein GF307_03080, partial [candidate division Zixibacteria bacterium]|nr:hypothetical protein [candidate division Zixibacteria bacterium]